MAIWQSQRDFPSETPRTRQVVAYLDQILGVAIIERAMAEYFSKNREGEQVTLACLAAIGEEHVRAIAERKAAAKGKSMDELFGMVKQHIGLWVAIVLARNYGPEKVLTYRRDSDGPSSTRQVPDLWKPELHWVSSYTPHKVKWD